MKKGVAFKSLDDGRQEMAVNKYNAYIQPLFINIGIIATITWLPSCTQTFEG